MSLPQFCIVIRRQTIGSSTMQRQPDANSASLGSPDDNSDYSTSTPASSFTPPRHGRSLETQLILSGSMASLPSAEWPGQGCTLTRSTNASKHSLRSSGYADGDSPVIEVAQRERIPRRKRAQGSEISISSCPSTTKGGDYSAPDSPSKRGVGRFSPHDDPLDHRKFTRSIISVLS